ncbi:MAG: hypothetical protein R3A47_11090 [Polyangiales bacterium]
MNRANDHRGVVQPGDSPRIYKPRRTMSWLTVLLTTIFLALSAFAIHFIRIGKADLKVLYPFVFVFALMGFARVIRQNTKVEVSDDRIVIRGNKQGLVTTELDQDFKLYIFERRQRVLRRIHIFDLVMAFGDKHRGIEIEGRPIHDPDDLLEDLLAIERAYVYPDKLRRWRAGERVDFGVFELEAKTIYCNSPKAWIEIDGIADNPFEVQGSAGDHLESIRLTPDMFVAASDVQNLATLLEIIYFDARVDTNAPDYRASTDDDLANGEWKWRTMPHCPKRFRSN